MEPGKAGDAMGMITAAYGNIQGYSELKSIATQLLGLALICHMAYQLYRTIRGEKPDYLTPMIKIAVAVVLINSLVPIGQWISQAMNFVADKVFRAEVSKLATDAWMAAFKGVSDPGIIDFAKAIFSPTAWLSLIVYIGLLFTMVIKFLVVDVAWPVVLGLVVMGGVISIPLSVFPGMNTFKGWVMNVVEVACWPLVFQITTTLLFGCMQSQLASMANLEDIWDKVDEIQEIEKDVPRGGALATIGQLTAAAATMEVRSELYAKYGIDPEMADGMCYTFIKYLAIVMAYIGFCLATPSISKIIVRSESAGMLGTMIAAGAAAGAASLGMGTIREWRANRAEKRRAARASK